MTQFGFTPEAQHDIGLMSKRVIIVTGGKHCGKTTLVETFIDSMRDRGLRIAGILAKGLWQNGLRSGFDLLNLSDGCITPFARRRSRACPRHGLSFDFSGSGFVAGTRALDPVLCRKADIVVVDEVGRLEARGDGWANPIKALLPLESPLFVFVVRLDCLQRIGDLFGTKNAIVIDACQSGALARLIAAAERFLKDASR